MAKAKSYDVNISKGRYSTMESPTPAPGLQQSSYTETLGNVNATTQSADYILDVISTPRKAVALGVLIGIAILIYFVFRSQIKNAIQSILKPIKDNLSVGKAENETGTSVTLTQQQLAVMADDIYAAFGRLSDDEDTVFANLRRLKSPADYEALKNIFGTRKCKGKGHSHGLEGMINCNFNSNEKAQVISILRAIGVPTATLTINTQ